MIIQFKNGARIEIPTSNYWAPFQNITKLLFILHQSNRSGFPIEFYPDTSILSDSDKPPTDAGDFLKGREIPVMPLVVSYLKKTNTPEAMDWIMKTDSMWIKSLPEGKPPISHSITCGGNFAEWDYSTQYHYHLPSYSYNSSEFSEFDPKLVNWKYYPHRFWKACAVHKEDVTRIIRVDGLDVYIPRLKYTEVFIPKSHVFELPDPTKHGGTYELRGMNVYLNLNGEMKPLLTYENGKQVYHTDWFKLPVEQYGVNPPKDWMEGN